MMLNSVGRRWIMDAETKESQKEGGCYSGGRRSRLACTVRPRRVSPGVKLTPSGDYPFAT